MAATAQEEGIYKRIMVHAWLQILLINAGDVTKTGQKIE